MNILSQVRSICHRPMIRTVLIVLMAWGIISCQVASALEVPQSPFRFVGKDLDVLLLDGEPKKEMETLFRERFFSPWNREYPQITASESLWAWEQWKDGEPWGENLRPHSPGWMRALFENCSMNDWGRLSLKAVACVDTDLRALPTSRPFFRNPSLAGEGFPFDYLQNSRVKGGEPLFAGHYSSDGAWVFVETGYAAGWVDARNIAFIDDDLAERWKGSRLAFFIEDPVPLRDDGGLFRFMGRIGTVLPLLSGGSGGPMRVGIPIRDHKGSAVMSEAQVHPGQASDGGLPLTRWNVAKVMDRILGTPYGWGDSGGNRDCSGSVRDIFTVFGIWLPRNSAAQARAFPYVNLDGEKTERKEERIVLEALPFTTLLRVPGHIMVYLGTFRGVPCVFHSVWGVRTLKDGAEGRHVIGSAVITTLRPGQDVAGFDLSRGDLADRITEMTFLVTGP